MLLTETQLTEVDAVFAMGIVLESSQRRVLLEIPNDLGWKLHFGCAVSRAANKEGSTTTSMDASLRVVALKAQLTQALSLEDGTYGLPPPRQVGSMRFEFENCDKPQPSMLVHVYAADMASLMPTTMSVGTWYDWDQVPYDKMWADDPLWMPHLLEQLGKSTSPTDYYFEGFFVFDGPPGTSTPLLRYEIATSGADER